VPTCELPDIKRHYQALSERETDEVVDAVADLIVTFIKGTSGPTRGVKQTESRPYRETLSRGIEKTSGL